MIPKVGWTHIPESLEFQRRQISLAGHSAGSYWTFLSMGRYTDEPIRPSALGKGELSRNKKNITLNFYWEFRQLCSFYIHISTPAPLPLFSLSFSSCTLTLIFSFPRLPPLSTFLLPPAFFYSSTSKNLSRKKKQGIFTVFIWSSLQPSEVVDSLSNLPPVILPFPPSWKYSDFYGACPFPTRPVCFSGSWLPSMRTGPHML